MNFGGGNKGSNATAALDNPLAFEGSESMAGGHEADLMNFGEVGLGSDGVAWMQVPGGDTLANGELNSLVGRQAITVLCWHSLSRTSSEALWGIWMHDKNDNLFRATGKVCKSGASATRAVWYRAERK